MGFFGRLIKRGENYMVETGEASVLAIARTELVGNRLLIIENHRGITELTESLVLVRVKNGRMTVSGSGLYIKGLNSREVRVAGEISAVGFEQMKIK